MASNCDGIDQAWSTAVWAVQSVVHSFCGLLDETQPFRIKDANSIL